MQKRERERERESSPLLSPTAPPPSPAKTKQKQAKVMRAGTDVTLVAFSKMVGFCLQAADALAAERPSGHSFPFWAYRYRIL